ncbi:MAG: ABC transporter substrate-binding protein/permease [Candidatus Ancillula sp.]|jgi:polar amino acid transport system substrate-binding protein|nr:ABC transporter substrate-binding protein/permease [Candidatus Ancillula sp.]
MKNRRFSFKLWANVLVLVAFLALSVFPALSSVAEELPAPAPSPSGLPDGITAVSGNLNSSDVTDQKSVLTETGTFVRAINVPGEKVYLISSDSTYAPFEFQNEQGVYEGIDVKIMEEVAKEARFNFEMKFPGFDAAVQNALSGQADATMAGMTITAARKEKFDFSAPYYETELVIGVKKGNSVNVHDFSDLKGKTVGVKIGTTSAEWLTKHQDQYGFAIKQYDTADQFYSGLQIGALDAIMDDAPVMGYAIVKGQGIEFATEKIPNGEFGFGVPKGQNAELLKKFDQGLTAIKGNGTYQRILDQYTAGSDSSSISGTADESTIWGLILVNKDALLNGLAWTLALALLSFVLAFIIAVFFGIASYDKKINQMRPWRQVLQKLVTIYVYLIRGVPLLVLAFFIYYGIPQLTGQSLDVFFAACLALTLNCSAYLTEIVRSGINAVPRGQKEASISLGLRYYQRLFYVTLPQAFKLMMPSFINQFVISLKDTTIVSVIGVVELLQTGRIIVSRNFESFQVYLIVGVIYLIIITTLSLIAQRVEKKMS